MFKKRSRNDAHPPLAPGADWRPRLGRDDDGYLVSDGEPLAESTYQGRQIRYAIAVLETFFADRGDVFVAGVLFVHYRLGDRSAALAPDTLVSFGGEDHDHDRLSYKLWEEPVPSFVLEVLSHRTWRNDVEDKRNKYAAMGAKEFWLFDPYNKYLDGTRLKGYQLREGAYVAVPPLANGVVPSEALGLEMRDVGGELRIRDPATSQDLLANRQERDAHRATMERLKAAETRIAELEMSQHRSPDGPHQAG